MQLPSGKREGSPDAGQRVQQRRFAGVGIANNRDNGHAFALAFAPMRAALFADFLDLFFEARNVRANLAAVDFQLAFAGTAQADAAGAAAACRAAGLAREMRPHARETRQTILVLRKFDLERAFFRARVLRENIEDERCAVEHLDVRAFKRRLDFALLVRVQFLVENQNVIRRVRARRNNVLQFAFADECRGIDAVDVLHDAPDDLQSRRFREPFEFVERIVNRKLVARALEFNTDEKRSFGWWCGWKGG